MTVRELTIQPGDDLTRLVKDEIALACGTGAAGLALLGVRRLRRGSPPLQMTISSVRTGITDLASKARAYR